MSREKAINYLNNLPDLIKTGIKIAKDTFDENGEDAFDNGGSIAGLIIKIYGKGFVDRYFKGKKIEKLEGFGFQSYLRAAFAQAEKSLSTISGELPIYESAEKAIEIYCDGLKAQSETFDSAEFHLVFKPQEHPAIKFAREGYKAILLKVGVDETLVDSFLLDFNNSIEVEILEVFGSDYHDHLADIEEHWLKSSEIKFLEEMQRNGRIGFAENENLAYETTFAEWKSVDKYLKDDSEYDRHQIPMPNDISEKETTLSPINELIDEYFGTGGDSIEKILFIIADFGKGKSVFLRNYAARLATQYLKTGGGQFPVYFNLRDYGNTDYSRETKLGVISNYLEMRHGIKIEDDHFRKKTYVFLIDSLDESGELTEKHVEKVIESITRINQLDPQKIRNNKILITSRPIDEGLQRQLTLHQPHCIKDGKSRPVAHFISVYGFKKDQFNHWLKSSLEDNPDFNNLKPNGFVKSITEIIDGGDGDIYKYLIEANILRSSELRRPIFAS